MNASDERRDMKRKLTTIFCADVSGYSRMMGADEARTLTTLKEYREAIESFIFRHHGRVVSWSGDGLLAEFASVVEAVQCAAEVQRELKARNASRDEQLRMTFRIGINLGDVMADGDDIFGEGVNIAARLQQMAVPGGILVSSPVYDQVRGKLSMSFAALGNQSVKNISGEVSVYAVSVDGVTPHTGSKSVPPQRWRDDDEAPPEEPARRGTLFRRGLAVLVDYCIVLFAVLVGALAINATVNPNIVRMDLDVPFISYGDIVDRSPWRVTQHSVGDDREAVTKDERDVTYSYLGLFTQTYRQSRVRGIVPIDRKSSRSHDGHPSAAPAEPVPPAPPVPAEPPPPAPPPPPKIPGITGSTATGTWTYSSNGTQIEVGPDGFKTSTGVQVDADGFTTSNGTRFDRSGGVVSVQGSDDDDDSRTSISFEGSDDKGFAVRFSHTSEQMLDPVTRNPITRPSLDVLSLVFLVLYFAIMEAGRRGTSIGKNAFDLAVTREDGRSLSFANALGRNAIKVLTSFILPIAILVVLVSRRRQGIHDRLAGTVVIEEKAPT